MCAATAPVCPLELPIFFIEDTAPGAWVILTIIPLRNGPKVSIPGYCLLQSTLYNMKYRKLYQVKICNKIVNHHLKSRRLS